MYRAAPFLCPIILPVPPEEWELTLTLEPEEEEQPEPGDGSALTDEDILLLGYLGRHLGGKK